MSSRALFTGDGPPGFLATAPHRVLDDLIQLVGGIPEDAEHGVGPGPRRSLLPPAEQESDGLGSAMASSADAKRPRQTSAWGDSSRASGRFRVMTRHLRFAYSTKMNSFKPISAWQKSARAGGSASARPATR